MSDDERTSTLTDGAPVATGEASRRGVVKVVAISAAVIALLTLVAVVAIRSSGGSVEVPEVAYQEASAARELMLGAGFKPAVALEPSATVGRGKAIRTDPPAGAEVARDTPLTLFISTGPSSPGPNQVDMPDPYTATTRR